MNKRPFQPRGAIALTMLLCLPTLALGERLPIKTYTTANGLARDAVARIVRDSKGFLWFCTTEGLSRFDGYAFTTFGREQGLPAGVVTDLVETRSGDYWVATTAGLCRFNPAARSNGGRPRAMFDFDYQGERLRDRAILTLREDRNGVVWAGGANGLFRLDQKDGHWVASRVEFEDAAARGKIAFEVVSLLEDRHGSLWILSSMGLFRRLAEGRIDHFTEKEGFKNPLHGQALLEDRAGTIWIATIQGVIQLTPQPSIGSKSVARVYTVSDGLANNRINSLFQGTDGRFWLGTATALSELLPSDSGSYRFRNYTTANGLSESGIGPINEDRNGNLWFGTEAGGVMKLAANGFTTYGKDDGLRAGRIAALLFDLQGDLCVVGMEGTRMIQRFNGHGFDASELRLPPGHEYWDWGWNHMMFQSRSGEWWMQVSTGVVRYPVVDNLKRLTTAKPDHIFTGPRDGISDEVFRIFEDSRGDVWIAGFSTDGRLLVRWDRKTGAFQHFGKNEGFEPTSAPTAFCEDNSGNLWIGFFSGGLARYHDGRLTALANADELPAGFVRAIYQDHASRLWVATTEGGAARIDDPQAERPRITVYNTASGLSSNQATCVTEDQWGRIYIGTGRGVDRLDPSNGQIKHYTTDDGLAGSLINVATRDRTGALWFGTLRGLSRLMPQFDPPGPQPPVVISELSLAGNAYPVSVVGETAVSGLVLEPNQNQVRISFLGLSFGTGETLRYQYKLEGARSDWSTSTEHREVNYAGLGPGNYTFLVRAITADGVLSAVPASVAFRILPPVWRRWWFLLVAGLVFAGVVIAIERYRAARMTELGAALDESRKLSHNLTIHQAELHRANATLALESDVTRVLAEASTPRAAAPRILESICESGGWQVGALWVADPEVKVLRCVDVWSQGSVNAREFEALTREQVFVPGVGLPGRVMQTGEPTWITDLSQDQNFPRLVAAAHEGLRSAFGFPILLESQVIGVMEFFSSELREPDPEKIQTLSTIGIHIGQLMERKRAEEALRESEDRFRTLAETASDAIITIDAQSTIIFVNPAAENVFGYRLADMVGEELTILMPEYLRHLHSAGFSRYLETGKRHLSWEAIELPGLHKSGREIPLEVSFGEFSRNGKRFFTGIARDISERKRAEEALERSREERLRELESVRRRIATDLHDDIGSSLTQIAILSEVIRQRVGEDKAPVSEPLSMIATASRELVDAMSDIVWAINPQKDHLADLTQRMRRFASDSFTAKNIGFQLRLPDSAEDIKLGANLRREVFLIFKESVNNIIRHSACTEAEIQLRFEADALELRLQDNGHGFNVAAESDGHGLLSMRDRAKGIGATLTVVSAPDLGTVTTLTVPLSLSNTASSQ